LQKETELKPSAVGQQTLKSADKDLFEAETPIFEEKNDNFLYIAWKIINY